MKNFFHRMKCWLAGVCPKHGLPILQRESVHYPWDGYYACDPGPAMPCVEKYCEECEREKSAKV